MSDLFVYICTRQTADPYVPPVARDLATLARDTADGFYALQGGRRTVGQLAFFPLQQSRSDHLLCDGREVRRDQYPELFEYLGTFMGTPSDSDHFVLPDYTGGGALTTAAATAPEVTTGNTVTSEPATPGGGDSGGSIDPAVDSGGRVRRQLDGTVIP